MFFALTYNLGPFAAVCLACMDQRRYTADFCHSGILQGADSGYNHRGTQQVGVIAAEASGHRLTGGGNPGCDGGNHRDQFQLVT